MGRAHSAARTCSRGRTDVRQATVGASARDSPTGEVADRLHAPAGTGASGLATGAGAQGSRGVGPDVSAACPGRLSVADRDAVYGGGPPGGPNGCARRGA